ncbi:hypothetical protein COBT_001884 [Conglomerata obtusa]
MRKWHYSDVGIGSITDLNGFPFCVGYVDRSGCNCDKSGHDGNFFSDKLSLLQNNIACVNTASNGNFENEKITDNEICSKKGIFNISKINLNDDRKIINDFMQNDIDKNNNKNFENKLKFLSKDNNEIKTENNKKKNRNNGFTTALHNNTDSNEFLVDFYSNMHKEKNNKDIKKNSNASKNVKHESDLKQEYNKNKQKTNTFTNANLHNLVKLLNNTTEQEKPIKKDSYDDIKVKNGTEKTSDKIKTKKRSTWNDLYKTLDTKEEKKEVGDVSKNEKPLEIILTKQIFTKQQIETMEKTFQNRLIDKNYCNCIFQDENLEFIKNAESIITNNNQMKTLKETNFIEVNSITDQVRKINLKKRIQNEKNKGVFYQSMDGSPIYMMKQDVERIINKYKTYDEMPEYFECKILGKYKKNYKKNDYLNHLNENRIIYFVRLCFDL